MEWMLKNKYNEHLLVYQILKLKEEIMLTCHAYVEGQYYLGKMNRKEAISYLKKHSFLDHYETELLLTYSDLELYYGIENFIGIMEMNSIRREYERKMDINFNLLDFHNFFLINGSIPANELKKKIKRL